MPVILEKDVSCEQSKVTTTHTVESETQFTMTGDATVTVMLNGAMVGTLNASNPTYLAKAPGEYTISVNAPCRKVSVSADEVTTNVSTDAPTAENCNGDEAALVTDPCVLEKLDDVITAINDGADKVAQEIDDLQTAVTEKIQEVIDTIDDGVTVEQSEDGVWNVRVENPTDINALSDLIAQKLEGLDVNIAGQTADLTVEVVNDEIVVSVNNFPEQVVVKNADPVPFCSAAEDAKPTSVTWSDIGTQTTYATDDYTFSNTELSDGTGNFDATMEAITGGYRLGIDVDYGVDGSNIYDNGIYVDLTFPRGATNTTFSVQGLDFLAGEYDEYVTIIATDTDGNVIELDNSNYTSVNDGGTLLPLPNTFRGVTPTDNSGKSIDFNIPNEIVSLQIGYANANGGNANGPSTEILVTDIDFTVPAQESKKLFKHFVYAEDGTLERTYDTDENDQVVVGYKPANCDQSSLLNAIKTAIEDQTDVINNGNDELLQAIENDTLVITEQLNNIISTIDDGIETTPAGNGVWDVNVLNPVDIYDQADAIAAALQDVTVTIAGQTQNLLVDVVNDSLTVSVDNFPIPVDNTDLLTTIANEIQETKYDVETHKVCGRIDLKESRTLDWSTSNAPNDTTNYSWDDYTITSDTVGNLIFRNRVRDLQGVDGYLLGVTVQQTITDYTQDYGSVTLQFNEPVCDTSFLVYGLQTINTGLYDEYLTILATTADGQVVELTEDNFSFAGEGEFIGDNTLRGGVLFNASEEPVTVTIPDEIVQIEFRYSDVVDVADNPVGANMLISNIDYNVVTGNAVRTLTEERVYNRDDGSRTEVRYVDENGVVVSDFNQVDCDDRQLKLLEQIRNSSINVETLIDEQGEEYEIVRAYDYDSSQDAFGFPTPNSYTEIIVKTNADGTAEYLESDGETPYTPVGEIVYHSRVEMMSMLFLQSINEKSQKANRYFQYTDTQTVTGDNIVVTFIEGTGKVNLNTGGNFDLDADRQHSTEPMQGTAIITPDTGAKYHVSYYSFL